MFRYLSTIVQTTMVTLNTLSYFERNEARFFIPIQEEVSEDLQDIREKLSGLR